jgi:hypothetical protein
LEVVCGIAKKVGGRGRHHRPHRGSGNNISVNFALNEIFGLWSVGVEFEWNARSGRAAQTGYDLRAGYTWRGAVFDLVSCGCKIEWSHSSSTSTVI